MPTPVPPYECFVGIDIAAKTFVTVWSTPGQAPNPPRTFDQTEAGFAAFQAQLPATIAPAQILIGPVPTLLSFAAICHNAPAAVRHRSTVRYTRRAWRSSAPTIVFTVFSPRLESA